MTLWETTALICRAKTFGFTDLSNGTRTSGATQILPRVQWKTSAWDAPGGRRTPLSVTTGARSRNTTGLETHHRTELYNVRLIHSLNQSLTHSAVRDIKLKSVTNWLNYCSQMLVAYHKSWFYERRSSLLSLFLPARQLQLIHFIYKFSWDQTIGFFFS